MNTNSKLLKNTAILAIIRVIASLVPLLIISIYNHPCADDYTCGILTHKAWASTHSLWEVLKGTGKTIATFYENWQGTYGSNFIMTLQPSVFADRIYMFISWIMMMYYLLLVLNLIYWMGWLRVERRWSIKKAAAWTKALPVYYGGVILLTTWMLFGEYHNNLTSLSAAYSLAEGHAKAYHEETLQWRSGMEKKRCICRISIKRLLHIKQKKF